ncbi:MAG: transposase, partial [Bacilli bacterium]
AKEYRLSEEGKDLYKLRKETIERIFAQGKEYHGLRFTRFRGLKKNRYIRYLLYACLNIKKLALLMSKRTNKYEYQLV